MNYNDEIDKLSKQLSELHAKQNQLERNCNHQWNETKYDPEIKTEAVEFLRYEGVGSDPNPIYRYGEVTHDRWSRTCKLCGKTEYTNEQKPTKYEPKFYGGNR